MEAWSAAVLAGGRSTRFGEVKAHFRYRGKPLYRHVYDSLEAADERLVIAADPEGFDVPVFPDLLPGGGSLSGVHAALSHARHPWVAVAACDLPFLTPAYWQCLLARRAGATQVVVENAEGHPEPLAALYHRSLLPELKERLESERYAVHALMEAAEVRVVPWRELESRVPPGLFVNANRRTDLP